MAVFTSCRSGGIGRRAWFRSMYSQGCGGSSPFFGTNKSTHMKLKKYSQTLLIVNILSAAIFFFCHYGINAPGLGLHDLGTAAILSFSSAFALYASIIGFVIASAAIVIALIKRSPQRAWLLSCGIAS